MGTGAPEDTRPLQAGLRTLHEAGPELKRAISGELSDQARLAHAGDSEEMPFISGALKGALSPSSRKKSPPPLQGPKPRPPLPQQRMPGDSAGSPGLSITPPGRRTATPSGGQADYEAPSAEFVGGSPSRSVSKVICHIQSLFKNFLDVFYFIRALSIQYLPVLCAPNDMSGSCLCSYSIRETLYPLCPCSGLLLSHWQVAGCYVVNITHGLSLNQGKIYPRLVLDLKFTTVKLS